jgi:hypothetical protein
MTTPEAQTGSDGSAGRHPDQSRVFRVRRYYLTLGVIGACFFAVMGTASFCAAYWNIDESFPNPVLSATMFAVVWGGFFLLSLWIIAAYFRERLGLGPTELTQQGVIRRRAVPYRQITRATWRGGFHNGGLRIRAPHTRLMIYLENFTQDERRIIVDVLRHAVPPEVQEGWDEFRAAVDRSAQPPPKFVSIAIACLLAFAAMSAVFVLCWQKGVGREWLVAGALCASIAVWYVWRILRFACNRPAPP